MTGIMRESEELFGYDPYLNFDSIPKMLIGDEVRIKYIVLCLIQKVLEKNKLECND
jgi:hypothetical protein